MGYSWKIFGVAYIDLKEQTKNENYLGGKKEKLVGDGEKENREHQTLGEKKTQKWGTMKGGGVLSYLSGGGWGPLVGVCKANLSICQSLEHLSNPTTLPSRGRKGGRQAGRESCSLNSARVTVLLLQSLSTVHKMSCFAMTRHWESGGEKGNKAMLQKDNSNIIIPTHQKLNTTSKFSKRN